MGAKEFYYLYNEVSSSDDKPTNQLPDPDGPISYPAAGGRNRKV
jgi:hypothetical protein